jgi:adenine-specific DNA-methyltransferase
MTITDINKILATLQEQKRDNVLDFAFALLQWMNIEPNGENKPQLLTPQTQKLKEFLATAPQTVQPQLYRISADNQPVRVRFAVLKKLKKEHISQLVDNDPGLGSYQSFSKGLMQQHGTAFIPTQPYFIHFVTTPDYNKLVLVFNQGEQKRIVSFRNRLTHTQYNKIVLAWQGIGTKAKPEIADLFWKSLDIKEVNTAFYKHIKERFDALLGIVAEPAFTGLQHKQDANTVKQFAVRMIGRYIFCWFLKEKGIIPEALISSKTIKETDNYYQTVLLPLFFKTLNTKVQDREPSPFGGVGGGCIPYLNGGLFDESDEDKLFTKLNLDAWLLPFVEILESYDFTVDESSSQYQQVAVDPEMLGRIFENLLASQNEETEKLANQRKAFGAFYTPREIVDYMVNESIKAYLQTQWEEKVKSEKLKVKNEEEKVKSDMEKKLAPLFTTNPDAAQLKKDEKNLLLQFLEQIKILDPACGSGAFPMGILHKLVELHEVLGTVKTAYELKKDILSQNIYGVDIMPMAIEIARLRAWLSLVLEEDYKPNDAKHNFGVKPLPNLDFKFVCANSLIDSGYEEFLKKLALSNGVPTLMRMDGEIQKLEKIRDDYFDTAGNHKKRDDLRDEFKKTKNYIKTEFQTLRKSWALDDFFNRIDDWNPFDDSYASSFFSASWMFGKSVRDGFDVVIGNPPYVYRNADNEELKKYFAVTYKSAEGNFDLYKFFLEKAVLILREHGNSCFIVPNTFLTAKSYSKLRQFIIENSFVVEIFDLGENLFEGVTVENLIVRLQKEKLKIGNSKIKIQRNRANAFSNLDNSYYLDLKDVFEKENSFNIYMNPKATTFINKLRNNSIDLGKIAYCTVGINTGYIKNELTSKSKIDKTYHKMISGRDIGINSISWKEIWIKYDKEFVDSFGDRGRSLPPEYIFTNEKILVQRTRRGMKRKLVCCYDTEGFYNLNRLSNIVSTSENYSLKYIHSLLNSSLMDYYFNVVFNEYEVKPVHLAKLPIKIISDKKQQPFISKIERILFLKKANQPTTTLEQEIDVMVYHLYQLSYDEVKIIDPNFWLSEEEYKKD